MTVLVGVKCTDGIVIGSDSIATSTSGIMPLMQVTSNDKIRIYESSIISASTGSVGLSQRLDVHIQAAIKGQVFKNSSKNEAAGNLSHRMIKDLQSTSHPNYPQSGLGFGSLLAAVIGGEPHLIEYDTVKYQPEFHEGRHCYVSAGSGQQLADPFLAFVSRVLWKNSIPDVRLGRFGIFWTLTHTIMLAPGMVGPPIKMATLQNVSGKWIASMIEDHGEAQEYIGALEKMIGNGVTLSASGSEPLPTPPVDN